LTVWAKTDLFPKAIDQHKPDKPKIPNGLGIIYVLVSTIYLFLLYYYARDFTAALPLAGCILFGGFMGLFDDWMDLRWRYKAFLPIFASLPIAVQREALGPEATKMATYIFGKIDFGPLFYIVIIPLIVTVTTNTVNQLGGLNGLETICPSIVMIGLMMTSFQRSTLLILPLLTYLVLAMFNVTGKIFVGNTGSFAVGLTLASYAIIANNEQTLLISILPFIFNSSLILLNVFLFGRTAHLIPLKQKFRADGRYSLLTLIASFKPLSERKLVMVVSLLVAFFTIIGVLVYFL
jgi:UDP-N-acetylglucosamine--dolichyl-phosphate N-acetylglucosaminephosphotransferase